MAGTVRATILTTSKGDGAAKAAKEVEGLSGKLKGLGNVAKGIGGVVAGVFSALQVSDFLKGTIDEAKNLERAMMGLDTIFGDLAPRMANFADSASKFGLSSAEAANASVFLGSVLQQYGFDAERAAGETEKLTQLAADLAITYGYDVQEALVAVTALFRGEYDPIEKFGVAMKQNEINAIKTARGLDDLTGSAEMNADANIRLELLYQRTAASQGAFERGTGTLVVEQEKLRAAFANLQAELGEQLIPVLADLFEQLVPITEDATPALIAVFEFLGEVMLGIMNIFTDFFDSTSRIGEGVVILGTQFDILMERSGLARIELFTLQDVFRGVEVVIRFVIDVITAVLIGIERLIDVIPIASQMFQALINLDWDTLGSTDWAGLVADTWAASDAAREARVQYALLAASVKAVTDASEINPNWQSGRAAGNIAGTSFNAGFQDAASSGAASSAKDFWEKLTEEMEKQSARVRLQGLGLSQALLDSILGDAEWEEVFDKIIAGGRRAAEELQAMFNQTAAGLRELEQIQKEDLERQAAQAERREAMIQDLVQRSFDASMERFEKFRAMFEDFTSNAVSAFTTFKNVLFPAEQFGQFESAVVSLEQGLSALIATQTELFSEQNRGILQNYVTETAATMRAIAYTRDELAKQIEEEQAKLEQQAESRKTMFATVFERIMGAADVTRFQGTANSIIRQLRRTVDQAINFETQLNQLRGMGLSDRAIAQIEASGVQSGTATARALLRGGESAVEEVNNLYDKLAGVAESQAENQSSALYDSGISLAEGLIEGLLSQQAQMKLAAEVMAEVFESTFNDAVGQAAITFLEPNRALIEASTREYFDWMDSLPALAGGQQRMIRGGTVVSGPGTGMQFTPTVTVPDYSRPASGSTPITINVNAGMGADGAAIGAAVVDAIARYESRNGRVFARA